MEINRRELFNLVRHAFYPARGECDLAGPDGARKVEHGQESRLSGEHQAYAGAPLVQCRLCGRDTVPVPVVRKVQNRLAGSGLRLENALELCPACRFQHFLKQSTVAGDARLLASPERVPECQSQL